MAQGEIKIRIGATEERSVNVVFGNIEKRASKLRDNLAKVLGGSSSAKPEKLGKDIEKSLAGAAKAGEKAARKLQTDQERAAAGIARAHEKAQRDIERALASATRTTEREAAKQSAVVDRETKRQVRIREKFAERTGFRATRFMFPPPSGMIGGARRVAGDIMRGAGVDLDLSSSVSRVVGLSSQIARLQNQAGFTGQKISHGELESSIKGASDKYGFSRSDSASALGAFADRTGDMGLGMKLLPQIAERAAAHGSSIDDMMSAAGEVALNLGDVKDKGAALIGVLDTMALQGAKGAIEMRNLAAGGMASIAAGAGRYEGSSAENMKKLGALAQIARQSGGAQTPAQAANAVARMTDQFTTAARIKQFKAVGVDVFSKTDKGQIADPIEIIKKSLLATGGDPMGMKKLFASSIGAKPVSALTKEFNRAGGGEAGIAAIDKLVGGFMESADIQNRMNASIANRDQEIAVKAQKFQNKLDDVTQKLAAKLLPTLEKLEEPALRLAEVLGKVAGYVAENPIKSFILALVAAVGRAGLESALRAAIEKQIMGGGGMFPGRGVGANGAPLAGGVWGSRAGQGLMALGAGVTGYAAGGAIGGAVGGERGAQALSLIGGGALAGAQLGGPLGAAVGAVGGTVAGQAAELGSVTEGWGGFKALLAGGFQGLDEYQNQTAKARRVAEDTAAGGAANAQPLDPAALSRGLADGIAAKTLNVKVLNAKDFATPAATGPVVPAAGRSPR